MKIFRTRNTCAAVAAALAMMGCSTLAPRGPATLRVEPVQVVRHGMPAEQRYRVARSLQDQGRVEEAVAAYRQVLLADPLHADAHNALGVIHALRGDATRAEQEFRLAVALAPQARYLRENLALHLERVASASAPATAPAQAPAQQPVPAAVALQATAPRQPVQRSLAPQAPAPMKPLPAMQPVELPSASLVRVADSVWQLRNGAFLQEVPVRPMPPAAPAAAPAGPAPVLVAAVGATAYLPAAAPAAADPAQPYRVEVSNGNGTTGLARRTSELLPRASVASVRLTNYKPYGVVASVIQHVAGAEAEAREVRAALPVAVPLAQVERIERDAKVRLLLGRDFPARAAPQGERLASR